MEWDLIEMSRLRYRYQDIDTGKYVEAYFPYYSKSSLETIAGYCGGSVMTMQEFTNSIGKHIQVIEGLFSYPENLYYQHMPFLIPDGSLYGLFFYTGASAGSSDASIYAFKLDEIIDMETGSTPPAYKIIVHRVCVGIPYISNEDTLRAISGDGYCLISNLQGSGTYYRGWVAFDTFENVKEGSTCLCVCGGSDIMDLENEPLNPDQSATTSWNSRIIFGSSVVQYDGTLFCELIPMTAHHNRTGDDYNLYFSEHIYRAYYDYSDDEEKVIELNGVKFTNIMASKFSYFPVE